MDALRGLAGSWRLEACEARDGDGRSAPLGDDPVGLLVYGDDGAMCVAIMRGDRRATPDRDILAAGASSSSADGYVSYAGTFDTRGDRVRHHVEVSLFPGWIGTVQERIATLSDDGLALELRTDPIEFGGRPRVVSMRWRRVTVRGGA